jgi:hypothetical protein
MDVHVGKEETRGEKGQKRERAREGGREERRQRKE